MKEKIQQLLEKKKAALTALLEREWQAIVNRDPQQSYCCGQNLYYQYDQVSAQIDLLEEIEAEINTIFEK